MTDNDLNVNYENVLADLRTKRDKLDAAIAGIETMLGIASGVLGTADGVSVKTPKTIESDTFFQMSIPDASRKLLEIRKKPQTTQEIADALETGGILHNSKDFPNGVGTILTRIDKAGGDIVKVGRAKFGLAKWYPGAKRRKPVGKSSDNSESGESDQSESSQEEDIDDGL